jgi:hypothetical protein
MMILDDTRRWRERPPEHMTRHNGGHGDDEYNSMHNDGGNGYRRAYQARAWQEGHQREASISILPIYMTITITVPQGQRRPTLLYSNRSRSQREPASNRSRLRISPLILYPSYGNLIFRIFRYHIRATGALGKSGVTCVPLICATEPLADSGALLIRTTLGSGVSTSGVVLLRFRPRLPLPLASLVASLLARFARASLRSS